MRRVRSVSGHVSLARRLPLPPLRSTRITRLHRYYERLRLPGPLRPLPRCLSLSEAARSRTPTPGSPWLLPAPRQARCGFSSRGRLHRLANSPGHLLPASVLKLSAFPNAVISGLPPSRSASPVTIAPRLLSRLRIKRPITGSPARLDTRPVASGYLGGTLTRWIMQHCHAATKT